MTETLVKSQKKNSKSKTTWENCNSPIRKMTPEEAEIIAEFEVSPELIGVEESTKFLEGLKVFANLKVTR